MRGRCWSPSCCRWAVQGEWPGFRTAVPTGAGGAGVTMTLVSKVCDCGLPDDGIKDLTDLFVSLNVNEEPGDAPGDSSARIRWHSLDRGVFFQGCILVCHGCTARTGPWFRL